MTCQGAHCAVNDLLAMKGFDTTCLRVSQSRLTADPRTHDRQSVRVTRVSRMDACMPATRCFGDAWTPFDSRAPNRLNAMLSRTVVCTETDLQRGEPCNTRHVV